MWKLIRQTVNTDTEIGPLEEKEGSKLQLGRIGSENPPSFVCESPVVSRKHCLLEFRNGDWMVLDFKSLNGTYINETKISASRVDSNEYNWHKICDGDTLGLGVDSVAVTRNEDSDSDTEVPQPENCFVFKFVKLKPPSPLPEATSDVITLSSDEGETDISEEFATPQCSSPTDNIPSASRDVPIPAGSPTKRSSLSNTRPGPASWKKSKLNAEVTNLKNDIRSPDGIKRKHEESHILQEQKRPRHDNVDVVAVSSSFAKNHNGERPCAKRPKITKSTSNKSVTPKSRPVQRKNPIHYSSDEDRDQERIASPSSTSCPEADTGSSATKTRNVFSLCLERAIFLDKNSRIQWSCELMEDETVKNNISRLEKQFCLRKALTAANNYVQQKSKEIFDEQLESEESDSCVADVSPSRESISETNDTDVQPIHDTEVQPIGSGISESSSDDEGDFKANVITAALPRQELPRKSILIDAPSNNPLQRRRGVVKSATHAIKFPPSPPPKPSPQSMQKFRAERLRNIALASKKLITRNTLTSAVSVEKPKVKMTGQSRADKLVESIASSTSGTAGNPAGASTRPTPEHEPTKMSFTNYSSLPSATTPLPVPDPGLVKQMPLTNLIKKDITSKTEQHMGGSFKRTEKRTSQYRHGKEKEKPSMKIMMHKSAVDNRTTETKTVVLHGSHGNFLAEKPSIAIDEPYKTILDWNPKWLDEQRGQKEPPNVLKNRILVNVMKNYASYADYVNVYYPLLVMEFWRVLYSDYHDEKHGRHKPVESKKHTSYEYVFGIEAATSEKSCPLVNNFLKHHEENSNYDWAKLTCQAVSQDGGLLDRHLDFAIVTLNFDKTDDKSKPVEQKNIMNRRFFAFVQNVTDLDRIKNATTVHKGLYEAKMSEKGVPSHIMMFNLIVKMSSHEMEDLYFEKPAMLKKVAYVAPKLREFKSVLSLHESPLFEKILAPSTDYPPFDPNTKPPDQAVLVSTLNRKLNSSQKLVVHQAASRIMQNVEPEVMLLHGPPGTGKTQVIVGLIVQLLKGRKNVGSFLTRILVCTPSNTAINEIIQRVDNFFTENYEEEAKPLMVRVGLEDSNRSPFNIDRIAEKRCRPPNAYQSLNDSIEDSKAEVQQLKAIIEEKKKRQEDTKAIELEFIETKRRLDKYQKDLAKIQDSDAYQPARKDLENQKSKVLQEAVLIFSTLGSCTSSFVLKHLGRTKRQPQQKPKIACCIVDEATQATEPESLAPLVLDVGKLFLVGDPCQLPATVISQEAADCSFGDSLFTRHYNFYKRHYRDKKSGPVMYLEYQYRMHPNILQWPNKYFYDGILKTPSDISSKRTNKMKLLPYVFVDFAGEESQSTGEGKISNLDEVKLVVEILKTVVYQRNMHGPETRDYSLGVITPYREQRKEIWEAIKSSNDIPLLKTVEVDTIDSYQGREKDILIISCVRSQSTGFLRSRNRACVALTRARMSLIIVGNEKCLNTSEVWKHLIKDAKERGMYKRLPSNYNSNPKETRRVIEKLILTREEKSTIEDEDIAGVKTAFLKRHR